MHDSEREYLSRILTGVGAPQITPYKPLVDPEQEARPEPAAGNLLMEDSGSEPQVEDYGSEPHTEIQEIVDDSIEEQVKSVLLEYREKELNEVGFVGGALAGGALAWGLSKLIGLFRNKSRSKRAKSDAERVGDLPFLTDSAASALIGKNLDVAHNKLDDYLDAIYEGDIGPIKTAGLLAAERKQQSVTDALQAEVDSYREVYDKLEDINIKLQKWADKANSDVEAQNHDIRKAIGTVVGSGDNEPLLGMLHYSDKLAKPIRRLLWTATVARQVAVNVAESKMPFGAENCDRAIEIKGSGLSCYDDEKQTTTKLWRKLTEEVSASVPMIYGGRIIGRDIQPTGGVQINITGIDPDNGSTSYRFRGRYQLLLEGGGFLSVDLVLEDHVVISRYREDGSNYGRTDHIMKVTSVKFPKIKAELGGDQ